MCLRPAAHLDISIAKTNCLCFWYAFLGKSWEKRAYVHFDIGHEEAKAHLDAGCTFVLESAVLRVHVSANSRDFDGAFTSSCELTNILQFGSHC